MKPDRYRHRGGPSSAAALAIVGLALVAGCAGRSPGRDQSSRLLLAEIDSLRSLGRYEAAAEIAGRLEARASAPGGQAWLAKDARRLRALMISVASADPAERRDLAAADSLTPVIERLVTVDEDYVSAEDLTARQLVLRARRLGGEHLEVAASLQTMARIASLSGEYVRCGEYLDRVLAIRESQLGPRHPLVAETLQQKGILQKNFLLLGAADTTYRRALEILDATCSRDDPARASLLESMGSLYRLMRRFQPSEGCYRQALQIRRLHPGVRSLDLARCLTWLGYARMYAGRLDRAEECLTEAGRILRARHLESSHDMANVDYLRAQVAWLRGDNAGSLALWEEYDRCRKDSPLTRPLDFGLGRLRGVEGERIDALLCEGRFATAWEEVCERSGPVSNALLNLAAARRMWPEAGCRLDSLRARVLELRRRTEAAERGVARAHDPQPDSRSGGRYAQVDSLRSRLARLDAERMLLERDLVTRFASTPEGRPPSPAEIQMALAPDQALVGWIPALWGQPDRLKITVWAFVLRRTGPVHWVHITTLNSRREGDAWTNRALREGRGLLRASQWPHRVAPDPELDRAAADVWSIVFRPLLPFLSGVEDLVIVGGSAVSPHVLDILPECLVDDQGVPLIRRYSFLRAPSPGAVVRTARGESNHLSDRRRSIIALADPGGPTAPRPEDRDFAFVERTWKPGGEGGGTTLIDPTLFRGALELDSASLNRLPPLPDARRETVRAASDFAVSRVLMGTNASRAALEAALENAGHLDVLHLATHALINPLEPERSILVLAGPAGGRAGDEVLTTEDILLGPLHDIDLVTLSGCQTSQGSRVEGGEELGFAQAFLAAGARSLLLSRWKVDDQATALLMGRFYENLTGTYRDTRAGLTGRSMPRSRALREAQDWLRCWQAPDGSIPFAHPVYWAGFALVGAPG